MTNAVHRFGFATLLAGLYMTTNLDAIVAADLAATALQTADSVSPAESVTYKESGSGAGESITAVVVERYVDWDQDERGKDQREMATVLVLASAAADPAAGVSTLTVGSDVFLVNRRSKEGGAWRLECSRTVRQTRSHEGMRS